MDDRLRPSRTPFGFSPEAAVWLAERVAAGFEPSAGMIDFTAAPFSEVTYAYRARPAARIALDGLPESMRDELLWWLCSLHAGGERVNSWSLLGWVRVAVTLAGDPTRGVCSFAGLAVEEWIVAGRRQFYDRHGRLPGAWFEHKPSSGDRAPLRRGPARLWRRGVVAGGCVGAAARPADPGARARGAGERQAALR